MNFFVVYLYVNGSGSIASVGGERAICLLLFTCNYVVSVWRGFLFLWVLGMGYVILLWHSLSIPYNYLEKVNTMDFSETIAACDPDNLLSECRYVSIAGQGHFLTLAKGY